MGKASDMSTAAAKPAVQPAMSHGDVQYPRSEIPMSVRDWIVAMAIIAAVLTFVPMNWRRIESLPPSARLPYDRSSDYWLFDRLARQESSRGKVLVLGDSVVWGHYVTDSETLSSQLNRRGACDRFANLGVDGIHPCALEGLIRYYGSAIRDGCVVLHCNLLWMSSPRHDLSGHTAFAFNHPRLAPQLHPWIPCYDEDLAGRLAIAVGRELPWGRLAAHLQAACFDGVDMPTWTLDHPYANPVAAAIWPPPGESVAMPPGVTAETWVQRQASLLPDQWVDMETSFQWACFRRAVGLLRDGGNRIFVVIGPFNEHMLSASGLSACHRQVAVAEAWLRQEGITCLAAPVLPGDEYADASHPLPSGYARMARQLLAEPSFAAFAGIAEGNATRRPKGEPLEP